MEYGRICKEKYQAYVCGSDRNIRPSGTRPLDSCQVCIGKPRYRPIDGSPLDGYSDPNRNIWQISLEEQIFYIVAIIGVEAAAIFQRNLT
jgi:hypothetical protein